jgi:SAM-dependent methyltransferase
MTATPDCYFSEWWGRSDDPWDHAGRFYESRKYDLTVASLPRPHYRRAFEPGCATGLLTARLAGRVDSVLATDRHQRAVAVAAERCQASPGVAVELRQIPDDWPPGTFDLIVLSEILYYLDVSGVTEALRQAALTLDPGGHLVAVHYRAEVAEHALTGDTVHRLIDEFPAWDRQVRHQEEDFVLEVFERR